MLERPLATQVRYPLSTGITLAGDRYSPARHSPSSGGSAARAPLVIFLHGGGQTRHAWGGTAEQLAAEGFETLTLDHRGHGESSWAEDGDYHFPRFADDLRALLPQLEQPPVIVGASLGGLTALVTEGNAPTPVCRGIVLVDVTPRLEREGVMRIMDFMTGNTDGFASLEEVADRIAEYLPHRTRPRSLGGLEKNLRLGEDGRYRWHWDPRMLDALHPHQFTEEEGQRLVQERLDASRRLTVPTLLVRGRMSDVVSEENAQEFLRYCSHAEYVDLDGAAHMVAGDKNDQFGAVVLDFVRRITSCEAV